MFSVGLGGFGANSFPVVHCVVSATEPTKGDEVDLPVLVQRKDRASLGPNTRMLSVMIADLRSNALMAVKVVQGWPGDSPENY